MTGFDFRDPERANDLRPLLVSSMSLRFGPIVSKLMVIVPVICCVSIILSNGARLAAVSAREFETYEHVTATVERTYVVHDKHTYQMSDIFFDLNRDGQSIHCKTEKETHGLKQGDRIDVVVQPGTCDVSVIVWDKPSYYNRFMIAFGLLALISFVLSVLVIAYAWRHKTDLPSETHKIEWS